MAKFTQISNGYTLEIEVDETSLLAEIDEDIQEMQELKKKHAEYEKERIEAEENGTEYKPVTPAFVGRMLTDIGLDNMTKVLQDTVVESTKTDEGKNA